MAEAKEAKKPEPQPAARSAAKCREEYEALARQVTAAASDLPQQQAAIAKEVKRLMGEPQRKFDELKHRKHLAAIALTEAERREAAQPVQRPTAK